MELAQSGNGTAKLRSPWRPGRGGATKREELALERVLAAVVADLPALVIVRELREKRCMFASRFAEACFGGSGEALIGKKLDELLPQASAALVARHDDEALGACEAQPAYRMAIDAGPSGIRQLSARSVAIRDARGKPLFLMLTAEDVTERLETESELADAKSFLDSIVEAIPLSLTVKSVPELRYRVINRAAEEVLGVPRDKVIGARPTELFPERLAASIEAWDEAALNASGEVLSCESTAFAKPGADDVRSVKRLAINGPDGRPQFLLTLGEDITERKRASERIAFMAHHDPLTGLPNRAAFSAHLERSLSDAAEHGTSFAVLCVDVDRFKEVNDVFGHLAGDAFLKMVAERLRMAADGAFIARFGGDEFTLVTACGPQPATAERLIGRLFAMACGDVEVEGHRIRFGISVGVSIFREDAVDANALISNADTALYRAKKEGRGTVRFYDPEMDRRTRERHALQQDLRHGLDRDELLLHYQPLAHWRGEIFGFEALIRWRHPKLGVVLPGNFIPAAEENGLILAIGEWTLRKACREAASWHRPLQIALNVSPVQLRHGDLPGLVERTLAETGLEPQRLVLEITEGALVDDFDRALAILRRLKALGVRIAMDDFGTGYSSLSYLQAFPFDKIKIDRSFVAKLGLSPQSATIVRAVIGLARSLKLPVLAEGVETKEQLLFLTRCRCDEIQGYLVGRPGPIEDYKAHVTA